LVGDKNKSETEKKIILKNFLNIFYKSFETAQKNITWTAQIIFYLL
jgi:hypothetical protein